MNTGAQVHTGPRGVISIVTHVVRVHGMDVPASERKEVFTVLVTTFGVRLVRAQEKNAAKLVKLGVGPSCDHCKLKHVIS